MSRPGTSTYAPPRPAPAPPAASGSQHQPRSRPQQQQQQQQQQQHQPQQHDQPRPHSSNKPRAPVETRPLKKAGEKKEDARKIGQWRIGRTIGKGSSGRVKIAKHAVTGQLAAIKIVPKHALINSRMSINEAGNKAEKILLGIEREIIIMKLIDHPNVMNLYDVWETNGDLYIIMEYVSGGELFDYLVSRGRLPPAEALHYFQQLIHAVDYCHRFNICHRDLKPENLLLDQDKNIKVADFGMAAWQAGEQLLETSCGSPHYASPEIVAGKAYNGASSDIWSCGVILFALLSGRLPFDDENIQVLLQKVKIGRFEMPDEIRGSARDLLYRMLDSNPDTRITIEGIIRHPFFLSVAPRRIQGRDVVRPPSIQEIERPVNSADEIDPEILRNLRTLFHTNNKEDTSIVEGLLSPESTWEKAIYHLLQEYRAKNFENFNMDKEPPPDKGTRRHVVSQHRRKTSATVVKHAEAARQAVARIEEAERSTPSSPVRPPRPAGPTPTKASAGSAATVSAPAAVRDVQLSPLRIAPPTTRQQQHAPPPRSPVGPRPPLSPRAQTDLGTGSAIVPAIIFQEPSPNHRHVSDPVNRLPLNVDSSSASSSTTSHDPYGMSSQHGGHSYHQQHHLSLPLASSAPASPSPISVPNVENEELQLFLHDIAQRINGAQAGDRSSLLSNSSYGATSPAASAVSTSQYLQQPSFRTSTVATTGATPGSAPITPMTPMTPAFSSIHSPALPSDDQFEDAENDNSDVCSVHSNAHTYDSRHNSGGSWMDAGSDHGSAIGLGIGGAGGNAFPPSSFRGPGRETLLPPGARPAPSPHKNARWSVASSVASSSTGKSQQPPYQPSQAQQQPPHAPYRTPSAGSSYGAHDSEKENAMGPDSRRGSASSHHSSSYPSHVRHSIERTPTKPHPTRPAPPAPVASSASALPSPPPAAYRTGSAQSGASASSSASTSPRPPLGETIRATSTGNNSPTFALTVPVKTSRTRKPVPLDLTQGLDLTSGHNHDRYPSSPNTPFTPFSAASTFGLQTPTTTSTFHSHSSGSYHSGKSSSGGGGDKGNSSASWFHNLFSFKAPHYTLPYHPQARATARELLESLSVHVAGSHHPHDGSALRCEFRGNAVQKAVRFRCEFTSKSGGMTMVQEKGALSSFKWIHGILKREWAASFPPEAESPMREGFVYV